MPGTLRVDFSRFKQTHRGSAVIINACPAPVVHGLHELLGLILQVMASSTSLGVLKLGGQSDLQGFAANAIGR
jgi:hypothetical protein